MRWLLGFLEERVRLKRVVRCEVDKSEEVVRLSLAMRTEVSVNSGR